ncbi:hypothetical protein PC120_g12045 [Phytophthora cactorum]|nr:hypothetical protein PC120_g12045 [Phytophthora cactorum]
MSSPTRATTAPVPSDPGIPHGPPSKKSKKRLRSVGGEIGRLQSVPTTSAYTLAHVYEEA